MLNKLYEIIENENIYLQVCELDSANALYVTTDNKAGILLDKNVIGTNKEVLVLLEELGHHYEGVLPSNINSCEYSELLTRSKNEYKALKYIANQIIPENTFKSFKNTNKDEYELAEQLNINIDLLRKFNNIYSDT